MRQSASVKVSQMAITKDDLVAAFRAPEQTFGSAPKDYPEEAWAAIIELSRSSLTQQEIGALAAGPLEDLLLYHGTTFIDRIEREARIYPAFRHLLGGVWEAGPSEVWKRIEKIRGPAW
jgi:hypothetical protein